MYRCSSLFSTMKISSNERVPPRYVQPSPLEPRYYPAEHGRGNSLERRLSFTSDGSWFYCRRNHDENKCTGRDKQFWSSIPTASRQVSDFFFFLREFRKRPFKPSSISYNDFVISRLNGVWEFWNCESRLYLNLFLETVEILMGIEESWMSWIFWRYFIEFFFILKKKYFSLEL